jgi:hypothetical protein
MASTDTRQPGPFATGTITSPAVTAEPERDPRFDNQPPLGERIAMQFEEELQKEGLIERAKELAEAAARAPDCDSKENAGKIGDFVKQCRVFEQALEAVREKHNRPLIDARAQLKARTDAIFLPISEAVANLRERLNAFMRVEGERVERERRAAEEEANRLRQEQQTRAEETGVETANVEIAPRRVEAPVARGNYGARVGTRVVWKHEIESVRQLPDRLLKHPRVVEALDKLIAAEIKAASGKCEIRGVRIWEDQAAVVR